MMKRLASLVMLCCSMSMTALASDFVWFSGKSPITYNIPKKTDPVVTIALNMWKDDMQQVTGMTPVPASKKQATVNCQLSKTVPFDGFRIFIQNQQIIIEASNGRGMAYGLIPIIPTFTVSFKF